jgi:integrase
LKPATHFMYGNYLTTCLKYIGHIKLQKLTLLSMGVPMKVVQEILGHSSILITMNIYGHVADGMQDAAMDKMDNLFKKDGTF